jgi:hypothetical protein
MSNLEVSDAGEFGWLVLAALVAGLILYVWDQIKLKTGVLS